MSTKITYPKDFRNITTRRFEFFKTKGPQQEERLSCAQCKDILIEPYQSACGCRFCADCVKKCNITCPGCHEDFLKMGKPDLIFDRAVEREILQLEMSCINELCEEKFTLKDLGDHLNHCKYRGVSKVDEVSEPSTCKCEDCGKVFTKDDYDSHRSSWTNIDLLCDNMKSVCPYKCSEEVHDNIKVHIDSCPRWIIDCPMKLAGCVRRLPREEMDNHVRDDVHHHMSLMMGELVTMKRENERIKEEYLERNNRLNKEIEELRSTVAKKGLEINILKDNMVSCERSYQMILNSNGAPQFNPQKGASTSSSITMDGNFVWKIENIICKIKDAKRGVNVSIFSEPFYSHIPGYKICLKMFPAGDGVRAENHVSIYFVIMEGEYDSVVTWPFKQKISLSLQSNDSAIKSRTINMKPDANNSCYGKPTNMYNLAAGQPKFISHVELIGTDEFIQNDAIIIHAKVF